MCGHRNQEFYYFRRKRNGCKPSEKGQDKIRGTESKLVSPIYLLSEAENIDASH